MDPILSASTALVENVAETTPAIDDGGLPAAATPDRGPTVADASGGQSLHHLTVVTPEGVVLDFRAAGIASRTLAKSIDFLIQFVGLIVAVVVAAITAVVSEVLATVTVVIAVFVIFYGYSAVSETWWDGKTIGKKLFGIKVITIEGGPVRFRHAAIRSMIGTFDFFFPTPGGLVALFFALLTKRSQRLGDLAAGTIVIREPKATQAPIYFSPMYGTEAFAASLDTSRLGPRQYALVREFLLRTHDLEPEARVALADQLALRVEAEMGNPKPAGLDGERYLVAVLHAHQRRFGTGPMPPPMPPPMSGGRV